MLGTFPFTLPHELADGQRRRLRIGDGRTSVRPCSVATARPSSTANGTSSATRSHERGALTQPERSIEPNGSSVGRRRQHRQGATVTPVALDAPTISVTELLDFALRC